jgi:hypothetical protein
VAGFADVAERSADRAGTRLTSGEIAAAAARIRAPLDAPHNPRAAASAVARAMERWRTAGYARREAAVAGIAARFEFSPALVSASLDALLAPFDASALDALASRVRRDAPRVLLGFVMPGNVAGAGLHELVVALIAGAGALVKTASAEPVFFAEFARTVSEIDPVLGARIAVFEFARDAAALAAAFTANVDTVVAYGDDCTIDALAASATPLVGFGSRLSGGLVSPSVLAGAASAADAARRLAHDVALFEQLGCLSPHHVFVAEGGRITPREFARHLAAALDSLAKRLPRPTRLPLGDAAAVRRAHEIARWRALGGDRVELIEGPLPGWTVICEPAAGFTPSPGFRTVYVSAFSDDVDLHGRLAPAAGRLEAFAVAGTDDDRARYVPMLAKLGVSWVAPAGRIQSSPPDWRHGGGAFIDRFIARR